MYKVFEADKTKSIVTTVLLIEGEYLKGSILGREDSSDEYKLSDASATDGSETPRAVLGEDITVATGETANVAVYVAGVFYADKLIFGAGHTIANTRDTLREKGIFLEENI